MRAVNPSVEPVLVVVVGDQNVGPSVVVEVGNDGLAGLAVGPVGADVRDAGLRGDVSLPAEPVVEVEGVADAPDEQPGRRAVGGPVVGAILRLLAHYFPGYDVSALGSVIGMAYGFLTGFVGGWSFAFLRNAAVLLLMGSAQQLAERGLLQNLLRSI